MTLETYYIYVATNGNDQNSGTEKEPIKTITEAKKRVKDIPVGDILVIFREGTYPIDETILFGLDDGGNENKRITYQAYNGEVPLFSSAKPISNWELVKENELPDLPSVAEGKIYKAKFPEGVEQILTLYNGTDLMERCHSQMIKQETIHEYQRMDSLNVSCEGERHLLKRVDFPAGFLKTRENMEDVELRFMPVPWTMNLLPISHVDEENQVATLKVEATTPLCAKPDGMWVENDIMYLTKEGQYCTNSLKREIYYWGNPLEEDIKTPSVKCYFLIEGQINYDEKVDIPVRNLHFKGLQFAYGMRDTTDVDYKGSGIQHDWEMFDKSNALVRFRGAEECSMKECYFYATSGTALRLDLHCQKIQIKENMFDNIGNMGILLCGYGPGCKDVNKQNIISNNIITRCGEEIWHGHGIFLWQSGENQITHNKIHHSARKAIGLCGVRITILQHPEHLFDEASKTIRWKEINETFLHSEDEFENYLPYLHTRDNDISYNEVYKVLEKIGDGSAVNISGAAEGNIISHNFMHHISTHFASSVLRTDDWQRGTTMEYNVIYKSNISGITRKNLNHIRNNFIVDVNAVNGYIRFASYPKEVANFGSQITGNIMYDSQGDIKLFGKAYLASSGACLPQDCKIEFNNSYCHQGSVDEEADIYSSTNISKDPLFVDIENHDFTFKAPLPNIEQIDVKEMGILPTFPKALLEKEYQGEMNDVYDRGRNPEVTTYSWW